MRISFAQVKRVWSRYKQEGPMALISKKRGMKSHRAVSSERREQIAELIRKHYHGCKPLFVSEKLSKHHGVSNSSEFIRKLMIENEICRPKIKKRNIHPRKARKESEGVLLQGDASDHDWFEGRGPRCHLHLFVDDATSIAKPQFNRFCFCLNGFLF